MNIKEIKTLINQKEEQCRQLRREIFYLNRDILEQETGYKDLQKVIYKGKKGVLLYDNGCRWKFKAYKKNGELSDMAIYVYNIEELAPSD